MAIITEAHVKQYNAAIIHLSQQKFSRLGNTVLNDNLVGEEGYYDQLGPTEMDSVTTRHGDTPITDPDHQRRQVISNPFANARLVDSFDKARILIEPAGAYAMSQAMGVARKKDQIIINAFDATARTGKVGGTATVFDSTNQDVGSSSSNEGLTITKLTETMKILLDAGVDPKIDELHIAISAKQLQNLLDDTTFTSVDFNSIKALMSGTVDSFMGFEFHIFGGTTTKNATLPISGTDVRSCFAYAKTGMILAVAEEPVTTIRVRPDKLDAIQVLTKMDMGATRLEEGKVVRIFCDETPD